MPDPSAWSCPLPLRDHDRIVMGHGGGGAMTAELVEHLFLPSFAAAGAGALGDAAIAPFEGSRLAITTDAHVVRPLEFPGGSIGSLAVHGTVNDLAMVGATPLYLTAGFVLEEGLELATLGRIAIDMGAAATAAGVRLVAGDTKVVEQGKGDGLFVTTTGVGVVPAGVDVGAHRIAPGDVIIVSAPLGVHGVAIMSVREGLEFGTTIESDTAPLHGLVQTMLASAPGCVHALRDPTRGGLAAALVELAGESGTGIAIEERLVPVPPEVAGACGFLGLDVLHVANEGVLVAFVAPEAAETVLGAMRAHECGARAVVIGRAVDEHAGVVVCETSIGGARVVDRQVGEQLPRIC